MVGRNRPWGTESSKSSRICKYLDGMVGRMSVGALLKRGPKTDDELWEFIYTFWNIKLSRTAVCADHQAPFDAFADAFFGRHPVSVWKASRGFGGKSTMLGCLALTEGTMGAEVTVLGGSAAQSLRIKEVVQNELFAHPLAPPNFITHMTKWDTELVTGGHIRALTASQRSVRGPHPQRLRLDEIDEMELEILEAAQGQPMMKHGIPTQTVMSSTHQYSDQTMTIILDRAKEKGWPIYTWCYRENLVSNDGWLPDEEVARKKIEISKVMWDIEYELQEPSMEGRAIDGVAVDSMFDPRLGLYEGGQREYIEVDPTDANIAVAGWDFSDARYATGVDWAKEKDWTVLWTFAVPYNESLPWVLVAYERMNKLPWPVMARKFDQRLTSYPGAGVHDATGIGNVVSDLIVNDVTDVVLTGQVRDGLWAEFVSAIEGGMFKAPRIKFAYDEFRFATVEDLWGKGHTPDSFVAGALSWVTRKAISRPKALSIVSVTKGQSFSV